MFLRVQKSAANLGGYKWFTRQHKRAVVLTNWTIKKFLPSFHLHSKKLSTTFTISRQFWDDDSPRGTVTRLHRLHLFNIQRIDWNKRSIQTRNCTTPKRVIHEWRWDTATVKRRAISREQKGWHISGAYVNTVSKVTWQKATSPNCQLPLSKIHYQGRF